MDDHAPTPEYIWEVSPFSRKAADRIIQTARVPVALPQEEYEGLCLTLGTLAWFTVSQATERPTSREANAAVASSFLDLKQAMDGTKNTRGGPPLMPPEWGVAMVRWLIEQKQAPRERGAPVKHVDQFIFPKLLGFYVLAFGRQPSASHGGPTERFVTAFLEGMAQSMATFKWNAPPEELPYLPDVPRLFHMPTAEAIRGRIKRFQESAETEFVELMFIGFRKPPDEKTALH